MLSKQASDSKSGKLAGKSFAFVGKFGYGKHFLTSMEKTLEEEGGTLVEDPLKTPPDYLVAGDGVGGNPPATVAKVQKKHPQVQTIDRAAFHRLVAPTAAEYRELLCDMWRPSGSVERAHELLTTAGTLLDMTGADFREQRLDGDLRQVDLDGADFRLAKIHGHFREIAGANFDGATLSGGTLMKAVDCSFKKTTMNDPWWRPAVFTRCDFSGAVLNLRDGADTTAVDCNFKGADLGGTDRSYFGGSDFSRSKFSAADFSGANLSLVKLNHCDFTDANLQGADLTGADLRNVVFKNADLRNAKFKDAILSDADFTGAKVDGADFTNANVAGAVFDGVDLSNAKNFVPKSARAPGPKMLELAQLAADSERFNTTLEMQLGPQETVRLNAALSRYGAQTYARADYFYAKGAATSGKSVHVKSFVDAMLKTTELWSRATPDFGTVKVDAKKCALRGRALQDLAVAAWHEACGLELPTPEELQKAESERAAVEATIRERMLSEILGGTKGVKAWNSRPVKARSTIGKRRKHDFHGASLTAVDLSGMDLEGSTFAKAELTAARFNGALLKGVDFSGAHLAGADFMGCKPTEASFEGAKATTCNMRATSFLRCNFRKAELTNSDFSFADVSGADFTEAVVRGVDFCQTKYDEKTILPVGFKPTEGLVWKGAGPAPGTLAPPPPKPSGSLSFDDFLKLLGGKVELARMQKAGSMLKAERFQLFAEVKEDHLLGIVKSQSSSELVYSCRLTSEGKFGCCTQNLRPCGGLRGALCKHLLVLIVGLAKAEQLDSATVDHWIDLSRRQKPAIEEEEMSATFLRHKGAEAGEIDWRPTETIPEDFYSM